MCSVRKLPQWNPCRFGRMASCERCWEVRDGGGVFACTVVAKDIRQQNTCPEIQPYLLGKWFRSRWSATSGTGSGKPSQTPCPIPSKHLVISVQLLVKKVSLGSAAHWPHLGVMEKIGIVIWFNTVSGKWNIVHCKHLGALEMFSQ